MEEIGNKMGNFLQQNPRLFAVIAIIAGIGLFLYTIKTEAKDLLARTVNRWGQHDSIFGERFAAIQVKAVFFVLSVVLVIAGVAFLISWRKL
jgi:uncharacterized membrane protein YidH (DUF202 family)